MYEVTIDIDPVDSPHAFAAMLLRNGIPIASAPFPEPLGSAPARFTDTTDLTGHVLSYTGQILGTDGAVSAEGPAVQVTLPMVSVVVEYPSEAIVVRVERGPASG